MEQLPIGENIKRLRREQMLTQEKLAQVLNISPQSISKWERGDSYPDIVILPALANYFGVTVDVLLGNDKALTEERIQQYISECKNCGDSTALTVAKRAYEDFPYDFRIIMLYVNMLNIYGSEDDKEEIIRLCGIVVDKCTDEKLFADAKSHLQGLISVEDKMNFLEKFIEYGENWDWFKVYPVSTDEGKILFQHEITDKWWHMNAYIDTLCYPVDNRPEDSTFTPEDRIKLIETQEKIFYAVFDENDLGEYVFWVGDYNKQYGYEYAALGQSDEAIRHIEKSVDGWIAYMDLPDEYTYKNILINHRPYIKSELVTVYCGNIPDYLRDLSSNPVYNFIRNDMRFISACERLQSRWDNETKK